MTKKPDRFLALDSWRGLCACAVALYHFGAVSHLQSLGLIRASYLFVDFFFVLSGFVIAANYRDRLAEGFGIGRFMMLRFGRVYPLHFFMILPFIFIDAAKDGLGPQLWQAISTNVLLIHGLGVNEALWLNFPSWSISTEFGAYVVFALIVPYVGPALWPWLLAVVAGPLILGLVSPEGMNSTFDYGFVRCLEGFALGVICFRLREEWPAMTERLGIVADSLVEIGIVLLIGGYLTAFWLTPSYFLVVPFMFAVAVLVFSREAGLLSRVLLMRPFLLLGTLSYSIYMVHALVRAVARAIAMALEHFFHVTLFGDMQLAPSAVSGKLLSLSGNLWLGDLLQLFLLAVAIGLAAFTYRFIEEPGRNWSRNLVRRARAA